MTLNINDFYRYIFDTPDKFKEDDAVISELKLLAQNGSLSNQFRGLLRGLNNQKLEDILYGNHNDPIELTPFPSDDAILTQFESLNQKYGYLKPNKAVKSRFIEFFKASKLMADFVELNNTDQDSLAFEHAYKLLVLTGANNVAQVANFFKARGDRFKEGKPIHDMLVLPIPKNDPPVHLADWQKLIKNTGFDAIKLFQQAPNIEKELVVIDKEQTPPATESQIEARAPQSVLEAEKAAARLTYQRAKENPELAILCKQYYVDEKDFNKCLAITPKKSDLLPDISIDGESLGHSGYHLVKLPFDDPRAFILGHITNCCQSIGGHSERCVIDGITREHNGFYVLLKGKPNGTASPMINGKINYQHYSIVGQGYAWLSRADNLTFDSWENLTPGADDEVIVPFLEKFGEQVTQQENSRVLRVTIGTGGKTPERYVSSLKDDPEIDPVPEHMAEGFSYGDANHQALVYQNENRINTYQERLHSDLQRIHQKDWPVKISSIQQVEQLEELFTNEEHIQRYKHELGAQYEEFMEHCLNDSSFLWLAIMFHEQKILTNDNYKLLASYAQDAEDIAPILNLLYLADPSLFSEANLRLLVNNANYATHIYNVLDVLYPADPSLVNEENLKLLVNKAMHISDIGNVLIMLYNADETLVNTENLKFIINHSEHAKSLTAALQALNNVAESLVDAENFKLLISHPDHAEAIATGIGVLYQADQSLVNDDNRSFLTSQAEHAGALARGLESLYQTDQSLVNDDNRSFLASHAEHAVALSKCLDCLYKADKSLVNDENRELLIRNVQHARDISNVLYMLNLKQPPILNDENFKFLINHSADAKEIYIGIQSLFLQDPSLVSDENYKFLGSNAKHAQTLANSLGRLHYRTDASLVNDENRNFLASHTEHALKLVDGLEVLYKRDKSLVNDENRNFLASHAEHAQALAEGLNCLYGSDESLVNEENRKFLASHAATAVPLAKSLVLLVEADLNLLNNDNRSFLASHAEHAEFMAGCLLDLYQADKTLLNDDNRELLAQNAQNAKEISEVLHILNLKQPSLVDAENFRLLIGQAQYAAKIFAILSKLEKQTPELLTNENYRFLINQAHNTIKINAVLSQIEKNAPELLTNENFKLIINKAEYFSVTNFFLTGLAREKLLTDENFKLLFEQAQFINDISAAFRDLRAASPALINVQNLKQLIINGADAKSAASKLITQFREEEALKQTKIAPKENEEIVPGALPHSNPTNVQQQINLKHALQEEKKTAQLDDERSIVPR